MACIVFEEKSDKSGFRESVMRNRCISTNPKQQLFFTTNPFSELSSDTHHVVVVVGAPEIRTVTGAEIGFVTFWLVDPLPVQVPPEVDVERAQAAALIRPSGKHKRRHTKWLCSFPFCSAGLRQRPKAGSWENYNRLPPKNQPSQSNDHAGLPEFSPAARGSLNKTLRTRWLAL